MAAYYKLCQYEMTMTDAVLTFEYFPFQGSKVCRLVQEGTPDPCHEFGLSRTGEAHESANTLSPSVPSGLFGTKFGLKNKS